MFFKKGCHSKCSPQKTRKQQNKKKTKERETERGNLFVCVLTSAENGTHLSLALPFFSGSCVG